MKITQEPDFGATGQFELTGLHQLDRKGDITFATTVGMERVKTLLLLGAGEAHLRVLKQLSQHRRADIDVTLVTPWSYKTIADMVPAFVAGEHSLSACQIDLGPIVKQAGVRWISARCSGLDANTSTVMLDYGAGTEKFAGQKTNPGVVRPAILSCDFLSIDTGTVMERRHLESAIPGAADNAMLSKPTEQFVNRWKQAVTHAKANPGVELSVCVVGADTEGIELCFAIRHGLTLAGIKHKVRLITHKQPLAGDQTAGVRRRVTNMLKKQGIEVVEAQCRSIRAQGVDLDNGTSIASQVVVLVAGDRTPEWLAHSGLTIDRDGRIEVNAHLQSTSHPRVFAAGGVAIHPNSSKLYARTNGRTAGADLAMNILATISDQPMSNHNLNAPRVSFLSCGGGHAIASWGPFSADGPWVARIKQRQDQARLMSYSS